MYIDAVRKHHATRRDHASGADGRFDLLFLAGIIEKDAVLRFIAQPCFLSRAG